MSTGQARKTVTLLFCDLTGSTALGEQLDPESLRDVIQRYFAEMQTVIERLNTLFEHTFGLALEPQTAGVQAYRLAESRGIDNCRERGDNSGQHINHCEPSINRNARITRALRCKANRAKRAAKCCAMNQ